MNVPPEIAYVTACALGLAFSRHELDDAVVDLLGAADGSAETLDAARAALLAYPTGDPSVARAADDLLAAAASAARVSAPAAG